MFAPLRVSVPVPLLVRPPSVALSPPSVEWTSRCPTVTLKPAVLMIAPPLRTLAAVSTLGKKVVPLLLVGWRVPPLKLNVLVPPPVSPSAMLGTLRVPPLRLSVPLAVLAPPTKYTPPSVAVPPLWVENAGALVAKVGPTRDGQRAAAQSVRAVGSGEGAEIDPIRTDVVGASRLVEHADAIEAHVDFKRVEGPRAAQVVSAVAAA